MRIIIGIIVGALSAAVYGLLSGYLLIQAEAQRGGAVVDLNNQITAIGEPRFPAVPYLAGALAGLILIYCYFRWSPTSPALVAALISAIAVFVALFAISWSIDSDFLNKPMAFTGGWRGWVQYGGRSPAIQLVTLLFCGLLVRAVRALRRRPAPGQRIETEVTAQG